MKTVEFLDAVKAAYLLTSDYQLAKKLAISQCSITNYRKGRTVMDNDLAVKVSELLDLDALYVVACVNIEREQKAGNDMMVNFWIGCAVQGGLSPAKFANTAA